MTWSTRISWPFLPSPPGNIGNADLEDLFQGSLAAIVSALDASDYVEFGSDRLVIHEVAGNQE